MRGEGALHHRLSREPYGESAADARSRGWQVVEISGVQNLAPVTDSIAVTDAMHTLESELWAGGGPSGGAARHRPADGRRRPLTESSLQPIRAPRARHARRVLGWP